MKRLELAGGSVISWPSPETVREFIGALGADNRFLVLRGPGAAWVQTAWCPDQFLVETRGPHVEKHVATDVADRSVLEDIFVRFLEGDTSWVDEHSWSPPEL